MSVRLLYCVIACLLLCAGCGGRDNDSPVPRPRAYPRIILPDTLYSALPGVPVRLEANRDAVAAVRQGEDGRSIWIDLRYPSLMSTLSITVTPTLDAQKLDEAVDNRLERILLNIGGNHSELTELMSAGGYDCRMFTVRSGTVTPLQFLAIGDDRIVAGTLVLDYPAESADSLSPLLDAAGKDMLHMLRGLK